MKKIKILRNVNSEQMFKELKATGVTVKRIHQEEGFSEFYLEDVTDESLLKKTVTDHIPITEKTLFEKVDSITSLEDVKKYLKGEL